MSPDPSPRRRPRKPGGAPARPRPGGRRRERDQSRRVAVDALVRVEQGAYSNLDLPVRLRRSTLDARDRAWVTDAVYGTLREQGRIDALIKPQSSRPIASLDAPVRAALRLGAYQLLHGVAPHAAVGETVSAAPPETRKYVNAVLRAIARTGPPFAEPKRLADRLSYPAWIVDALSATFGAADAEAALRAMNEPPAVTLRVNQRRTDADALAGELERAGVHVERGVLVVGALRVRGTRDVGALRAVRDGRATPQDEASQAIAALVAAQPGERIADLAAAPGGKTTAIAESIDDDGVVVAIDLHRGRLERGREAAGRLRLESVHAVAADARRPPFASASFDRVLLDAPCSGLGVLRRRAEARWRIEPSTVTELAELQRSLLDSAAALVRPGGRIVYSVCTLTDAETVAVDEWLGEAHPELRALEPPPAPWRPRGRGAIILPHDAGTDGMFVAVYERAR